MNQLNKIPHGWQANAGLDNYCIEAARTQNLAQTERTGKSSHVAFRITALSGCAFTITLKGRVRWALERLLESGATGCTPIAEPAPRWSAYIHALRLMGVEIETVHEPHDGEFAGHHGRYVLKSNVRKVGAK